MKRMNEVFELPVVGYQLECIIADDVSGLTEDYAAHAINHIDALADALESLIDTVQHDHWVSFKGTNPEAAELPTCRQLFELSPVGISLKAKTQDAIAVLNAYRGVK